MSANVSARAATSPELVKFRSPGDFTLLGLAIQHPVTVYTARINMTFPSGVDGIIQLAYDGGSGTLANVLKNMLVFIGSAAGLYDKGLCRIRQLPTSNIFHISQTSHIQFADNDYITVVDSMPILQRDISSEVSDTMMDWDIQVGDLDNGGAIPRIGPLVSVLKLVGGTVTFTPPSPALSACYDGATIVSYLYAFPGAASTSNLTSGTGTATATYDTAGEYRWSCTITDDLGRETTAYRRIFVDPAPIDFILESCSGDLDSGDWSFTVTCLSGVTRSEVYDRALVALHAVREFYDHVEGSIGKIAGYENIKCAGWIDGESITYDLEGGEVTFTVRGPLYWLSKLRAFPFALQDTSIAPTSWKEIQEMTVDKALAFLLYWTSTAPTVMDCFFTGSEIRKKVLVEPGGSLLEQINAMAMNTIFAKPLVNNYGQLYVEIDQQLIPDAERDALPVVMDITRKDRIGALGIERNPTPRTSMVELGAINNYDGITSAPVYARAPGNIGEQYGGSSSYNNYVVLDQDECNRIAGCLLAVENTQYEPLEIKFSTNNSLIDIAPRQYCTISVAAEDTPRGIVITNARLIPRRVGYEYDKEAGILSTVVTFEFEAIGVDGVEYHPPTVMDNNLDSGLGEFGDLDFPGINDWFPPDVPPEVTTPCDSFTHNVYSLVWSPRQLFGSDSTQLIAKAYFPCTLRSTGSTISLSGIWFGDAPVHYAVYAVSGGARVLTAVVSESERGNTAIFMPVSNTAVDGFELELDLGIGSIITGFAPGKIIETGILVDISTTQMILDDYYAIEAVSGFWTATFPAGIVGMEFYNFKITGDNESYNAGVGYTPSLPGMSLSILDSTLASEAVTSLYGRIYFQSGAGNPQNISMRPSDTGALGVVSTLEFILRKAIVLGRRIQLGPSGIADVCAL